MDKTIIIGTQKGSSDTGIDVEYQAMSGLRTIRIPNSLISRRESLGDGRLTLAVNFDETEAGRMAEAHIGSGPHAPLHVDQESMMIVEAMEHGEPLPDVSDDVPVWDITTDKAPSVQIVGQVGTPVNTEAGPFDAALLSGGRENKVANWDFDPVLKPAFVLQDNDDNGSMGATISRVNKGDGEPAAFHIFNPDYKDENRPMGAHLNTVTDRFYAKPYREGFEQIMELATENGWNARPIAFNEGGRATLYCDVTDSINWDEALTSSVGQRWQELGLFKPGDYRVGFSVNDSLDGSSAFKVQAVAMRLQCTNGMVLGNKSTLISMKHTDKLKTYDFSALADKINKVILAAQEELMLVESMKGIEVERDSFEKLMTLCEKNGLITKPKVTRDDAGQVTALGGAHMWRLMGQGWTNPSEPWVAVSNEDRGSLYHVYNILTGAVTHKPEYQDASGAKLKGRVLTVDAVTDRLSTIHNVFGKLARNVDSEDSIKGQLDSLPMFSEIIY